MKKKRERLPIDIHQSRPIDQKTVADWVKEHTAYVFDRLIGRKSDVRR